MIFFLQNVPYLLITTCLHYLFRVYFQGISLSGKYDVDPDGPYANEKPFSVFCSFPENLTIIGENVEIIIDHCDTDQCHQATINYDMPHDQMKKLFQVSGTYMQEIQFHCKSAPLQVLQ